MLPLAPRQTLCRLEDLADPGSRGFSLRLPDGSPADILVVRRGTECFAYRNHCPHTGSPLDWQPDQFLNLERTLIQCATHSAMFRIEDGRCIAGPCRGQALTPMPLEIVEGRLEVAALEVL
ncbi:MAG: Rieske 2Fe-2S domain-containing protein [Thiohalobacteraceae bacterium]